MKKYLLLIVVFLKAVSLYADFSSINGVAGMGLADCYYPDRLSSVPINPSAGASDNRSQLLGSYYLLFDNQNAHYTLFGYKQALGDYNLSFLWSHFARNNIEVRYTLTSLPDSYTYAYQNCYYLSVSGTVYDIDAGLSVKSLYYDIYGKASNYAFGVDAGLSKMVFKTGSILSHQYSLTTSVACINAMRPELTLDKDVEIYPTLTRLSLLNKITFFPRYDMKNESFSYDVGSLYLDALNDGTYAGGVEYRKDNYMLRCGYNPSLNVGWSLGLGLDLGVFSIDYAFRPMDFASLHFVEFTYSFGQVEEKDDTPRELTDYLNEEKKATRLYNNYYEKAEVLFGKKSYSDALDILNKITVIFPGRKDASDSIEKNINSMNAGELSRINSEFMQSVSTKDYNSAYTLLLKGIDISPLSGAVGVMKGSFDLEYEKADLRTVVDPLKSAFINKCSDNIDNYLKVKDFDSAKIELKKIFVIDPKGEVSYTKDSLIKDSLQAYSSDLVKRAMRFGNDKKYAESYYLFKEAYRVTRDDSIKFQMDNVKSFIKVSNSPNQDLYIKKCYLIAANAFVNGEYDESRGMFYRVKQGNPLFDYDVLEDRLIKSKVIERNLP
jgi:tetratricopeptide (TPR) repeat protein